MGLRYRVVQHQFGFPYRLSRIDPLHSILYSLMTIPRPSVKGTWDAERGFENDKR
jgi:hypothetical protein